MHSECSVVKTEPGILRETSPKQVKIIDNLNLPSLKIFVCYHNVTKYACIFSGFESLNGKVCKNKKNYLFVSVWWDNNNVSGNVGASGCIVIFHRRGEGWSTK